MVPKFYMACVCSPHIHFFLCIYQELGYKALNLSMSSAQTSPGEAITFKKATGNELWSSAHLVPLVPWNVSLLYHINVTQNNVGLFDSKFTSWFKKNMRPNPKTSPILPAFYKNNSSFHRLNVTSLRREVPRSKVIWMVELLACAERGNISSYTCLINIANLDPALAELTFRNTTSESGSRSWWFSVLLDGHPDGASKVLPGKFSVHPSRVIPETSPTSCRPGRRDL